MNNQTMRLAVEAGFLDGDLELFPETIERFAQLVRQDEREACAMLCDVMAKHPEYAESATTKLAAAAIRAKGEK
jgi:hypothetical protein